MDPMKIGWLGSALDGPGGGYDLIIACSPHEHGLFRGDWLLYGRVADGALEFEGLFEPWT